MRTARSLLIEFLQSKNGQASLHEAELILAHSGRLGLGVEAIDVIHAAARDGEVRFDPKAQMVFLVL